MGKNRSGWQSKRSKGSIKVSQMRTLIHLFRIKKSNSNHKFSRAFHKVRFYWHRITLPRYLSRQTDILLITEPSLLSLAAIHTSLSQTTNLVHYDSINLWALKIDIQIWGHDRTMSIASIKLLVQTRVSACQSIPSSSSHLVICCVDKPNSSKPSPSNHTNPTLWQIKQISS